MRFTNLRPQIAGLVRHHTRWMMFAGCILLQHPAVLRAQADSFFPESAAPPRSEGQIGPGIPKVRRSPEDQKPPAGNEGLPTPLVEPAPTNWPGPLEERKPAAVELISPRIPIVLSEPMRIAHEDCPWPSRHIPNMFGGFFGAGRERLTVTGDELLEANPSDVFDPNALGMGDDNNFFVIDPGSSVLGRQKPSENNSPWTRDRFFFNYTYLANTSLQDGGVGVHRFVPGVERAFANGLCSWELRLPMGSTFDSESILPGGASRDQLELGNLYVAMKVLLHSSNDVVIAAGLGGNFPTADDLQFNNTNGRALVRVENSAVHVMPYLAAGWIEDDRGWFLQSFLQLDYDANGNPVLIDNGAGLTDVGNFRDANYLYWDIACGYWLIKDRPGDTISGIAPVMEIQYHTALNTPDGARSDAGIEFGINRGQVEVVNLLLGVNLEIANCHSLAIGYGTPIGGGNDEQYDSELRILLNWHFGGP